MADAPRPVLELRGITKKFGSVVANDRVDFDVYPGEVHALLGENGAGKSTLVSVLYGLYTADEGEILVGGRPVEIDSPATAIRLGIGMVHQHFMLVPVMTVAENIVLGQEPTQPALYRGACILVLDEPTAVLTAQEVQELIGVLNRLKQDGTAIVFISHKLGEVLRVADRITVLRHGKKIDTVPREGATEQSLARLVVGRDVLLSVEKGPPRPAKPMLEVEDLHVRDDRDLEAVNGASMEVRARSWRSPASTATASRACTLDCSSRSRRWSCSGCCSTARGSATRFAPWDSTPTRRATRGSAWRRTTSA